MIHELKSKGYAHSIRAIARMLKIDGQCLLFSLSKLKLSKWVESLLESTDMLFLAFKM